MRQLFNAITAIIYSVTEVIKKAMLKIKQALAVFLKPIFHFILLLLNGIYHIFKAFFLYVFIKPILFLYHHVVKPIGKALKYISIKFYQYIIRPPLLLIKFLFKKLGAFLSFLGKRIAHFFSIITFFIYHKIFYPVLHFLKYICCKIGLGIKWVWIKITHLISSIARWIYEKIIHPVCHIIYLILNNIGYFIEWFFEKIFYTIGNIIQLFYYILIEPIGHLIWFIIKHIGLGIKWILQKIFTLFSTLFKFIYYKIICPIGHFIYKYILKPLYSFFSFIYLQLERFFDWLIDKLAILLSKIGKLIWKGIKFIYQLISVSIVVSVSVIACTGYTVLVYPFRIIIENKAVLSRNESLFIKKWLFNPYYLFLVITEKNKKQLLQYKEKKSDLIIFIQIKNIVAYVSIILYAILLYPLNLILLLFLRLFI